MRYAILNSDNVVIDVQMWDEEPERGVASDSANVGDRWDGRLFREPAPTLAEAKALQVSRVNAACQAAIYAGFTSSALGAPHSYPAKPQDQANLVASVMSSLLPNVQSGWTTPYWCADSDGKWSYAPHTAAQIQQVGSDGKAAVIAALDRCASLQAEIAEALSADVVLRIAW